MKIFEDTNRISISIKDNYSEFDKALEFVENELSNYYVKEYIIDNYKNLVISNTKEKDLDVYNFFLPNIREYLFPTCELRGEKRGIFENLKIEKKKFMLKVCLR